MRKTIFTILSLLMVFQLSAQDFNFNGFTYQVTSTAPAEVQVTGRAAGNTDTDIIIPNEVELDGNLYSVTNIVAATFYSNQLTRVEIPEGVTSIGSSAFGGNFLHNIHIPEGVTSIGSSAFAGNILYGVYIPESVTSIGDYAFSGNELTSVYIPEGVISIEDSAFADNQLTSVYIPESVISIGDSAFANNNLTSVYIPESVTIIGQSAFENNNLTSVEIPSNVISIGYQAFRNNWLLETMVLNMQSPVIFNYIFTFNASFPVSLTIPCGTSQIYADSGWNVNVEKGISSITEGCIYAPTQKDECVSTTDVNVSGDRFVNVTIDNKIVAAIKPKFEALGSVTGSVYVSSTQRKSDGNPIMSRTVYLNPEVNTAATVRIYVPVDELNALKEAASTADGDYGLANLQMTKVSGDNCGVANDENVTTKVIESSAITVGLDEAGSYLEFEVDGFSSFTASFPSRTLPVELVSFDAEAVSLGNKLTWETATEINNDYFEVERSQDGLSFMTIGRVEGRGTTTQSSTYEYLDTDNVVSAYYRLRQVDYDGTVSYSKVIRVVNNERGVGIYPNPVSETLYLTSTVDYTIYNALGQVVLSGRDSQVDVSTFEAGMYVIRLGDGTVQQFIVK